jgi:hypothetical protein
MQASLRELSYEQTSKKQVNKGRKTLPPPVLSASEPRCLTFCEREPPARL